MKRSGRKAATLTFLGAAGAVTGSCYLLETPCVRLLLECGQVQGSRKEEARNREPLPLDGIDAVVLSHAHIDHSGRLPLLWKQGYRGPVYTHDATRALCDIMLIDSAYLQEKDAEWENRKRARRGLAAVTPLYTREDAQAALTLFRSVPYGERREILPGIELRLSDAGHILGSAIVELWITNGGDTRKLLFSGDLGFRDAPLMDEPARIDDADVVLMESTYGDRDHRSIAATLEELKSVFLAAADDGGNVLIPAFAVGRSQDLLYLMAQHFDEWQLGGWRIFLDSPMAIDATRVYAEYRHLYSAKLFDPAAHRPILPNIEATATTAESMRINAIESGAIVIAGSGMCNGGRILHHLKHNAWRPECHVVMVGYQAAGTLGRQLVDGAPYVRLWQEAIRVKAHIHTVGGLSAHAGQSGLVDWYGHIRGRPPVHLVHGEERARAALAEVLRERYGARCTGRKSAPSSNSDCQIVVTTVRLPSSGSTPQETREVRCLRVGNLGYHGAARLAQSQGDDMATAAGEVTPKSGFFNGPYGRFVLPGVILQSVLIGGGYATGREIVQFGARFGALGWIAGLAVLVGFSVMGFLTFEISRRFQAFDYRTLLKQLIGPLYWLFDIVYVLLAILIIAIMAAATGEILNRTLGLDYWVGVVLIVVLVGLLNFYGEGLIERFKSIGTALLYAGYILFSALVIAKNWDQIANTLSSGDHSMHPEASAWTAVWSGILYIGYNLAVYPAALFTVRRQTRLRETVVAGIVAGLLMTIPWVLTYFALMAFYPREAVLGASVPWLEMLSDEGAWIVVIFGIVVGWTLIETATGMIYALVARVDQNLLDMKRPAMSRRASGLIAVLTLLLALVLAQVGIIDLVAKGYTAMAYVMIAVFGVPLLLRGTWLITTGKGLAFSEATDPTVHARA